MASPVHVKHEPNDVFYVGTDSESEDIDMDQLQPLAHKFVTKSKFPVGCKVWYNIRFLSGTKHLQFQSAHVEEVSIHFGNGRRVYTVNSETSREHRTSHYEDQLAYAISCPVKVKKIDTDEMLDGVVVYLERQKGTDGIRQITYAVQYSAETSSYMKIESGIIADRITYKAKDCGIGAGKESSFSIHKQDETVCDEDEEVGTDEEKKGVAPSVESVAQGERSDHNGCKQSTSLDAIQRKSDSMSISNAKRPGEDLVTTTTTKRSRVIATIVEDLGVPKKTDAVDSNTSVTSMSFQTRCVLLLPTDVDPVFPSSVKDLSRASIAYTAPRGTVRPPDETVASGIGELTRETLSVFIKEARLLESPTEDALIRLLPRKSRIRDDEVRHLFRNFADCSSIESDYSKGDSSIIFSRREIDIVNYYSSKGKVARDMATLMPYRAEYDLRKLAHFIEDMELCLNDKYVEMLNETVGILDSLEVSRLSEIQKLKKHYKPRPSPAEARKKQLEKRQSPELTEEERQILPQWAVHKTLEWRNLVSGGDPRPIFGCTWCGPKIRADYEGPLLVKSNLCPTCEEFEKEGYYMKIAAGGSKRTFCLGNETVWWSNQAYLMGTTDKVAEYNSQKA
eukprot:CAMPEP_0201720008 /NCGR_PEP_ID=MMETSP0593-20130828/5049_1 /ASSEMBLY_ACC=CAM_ASM_000672 /TAXON_ID=267983 /ORGANISM="Skeletonema japonicum, Strain CCMP2506" /LENGTH=620 /DNA_ID=CAMNT_0048210549 /DNA_START=52 /DNA_END=1914 /DNA_ORIENTATION=+